MTLCEHCSMIDFERLKFHGGKTKLEYKLPNARSILRGSKHCSFCKLIVSAWGPHKASLAKNSPDYRGVSVTPSDVGFVPRSEDDSDAKAVINCVSVYVRHMHDLWLHFDFYSIPLPTVKEYVASKSLYLDESCDAFSSRLVEEVIDIKLAKKWQQLCLEKHGDACEHPKWLGRDEYPSNLRVLDIVDMKLVNAPGNCKYVALSYVWGRTGKLSTPQATTETLQEISQPGGIRLETLPNTIADVIRLVGDVGERYLWVDLLCIVQDDDRDKATYISQLDLIYARSVFTVVVAVGEDCEAGLSRLYRPGTMRQQIYAQVSSELGLMSQRSGPQSEGFNKSKWSTRGWTYQELQLSRRALIFYKDEMYWNCECDFWVERLCLEPSNPKSFSCFAHTGVSLGLDTTGTRFNLHSLGQHIYNYNLERQFTREGDAFDAFRGILNRIQFTSGISFYWGLSRKHFHHALLWKDETPSGWQEDLRRRLPCKVFNEDGTSQSVQIPSWSWLGWYVRWYGLSYPGKQPQYLDNYFIPRNTDWAPEWVCVDMERQIFTSLELSDECCQMNSITCPTWAGEPIEQSKGFGISRDFGLIAAHTSHNKLRIRAKVFDIDSRKVGKGPYDGFDFELLDEAFKVSGQMKSTSLLRSVEEWDEQAATEEEAHGALRDFIVMSRERHAPLPDFIDHECEGLCDEYDHRRIAMSHGFDIGIEYKLNIMLIKWSSEEQGVASRQSLFQISEKCWIDSAPQWKRVTLH